MRCKLARGHMATPVEFKVKSQATGNSQRATIYHSSRHLKFPPYWIFQNCNISRTITVGMLEFGSIKDYMNFLRFEIPECPPIFNNLSVKKKSHKIEFYCGMYINKNINLTHNKIPRLCTLASLSVINCIICAKHLYWQRRECFK